MYKKGESILHPRHGAGELVDIQTCEIEGVERRYYCIELAGDKGRVMVPIGQAEDVGLHLLVSGLETINDELSRAPENLTDDYRKRHARMAAKVRSGDPKKVAQVLRDLVWRKQEDRLSVNDEKLMRRAREFLTSILALQLHLPFQAAAERLDAIIGQAFRRHITSGNSQDPETDAIPERAKKTGRRTFLGLRPFG